jgi:hypothetical protein
MDFLTFPRRCRASVPIKIGERVIEYSAPHRIARMYGPADEFPEGAGRADRGPERARLFEQEREGACRKISNFPSVSTAASGSAQDRRDLDREAFAYQLVSVFMVDEKADDS